MTAINDLVLLTLSSHDRLCRLPALLMSSQDDLQAKQLATLQCPKLPLASRASTTVVQQVVSAQRQSNRFPGTSSTVRCVMILHDHELLQVVSMQQGARVHAFRDISLMRSRTSFLENQDRFCLRDDRQRSLHS